MTIKWYNDSRYNCEGGNETTSPNFPSLQEVISVPCAYYQSINMAQRAHFSFSTLLVFVPDVTIRLKQNNHTC